MKAIVRTTITTLLIGVTALVAFGKLRSDWRQQAIEELQALNAEMEARLDAKEAMLDRLERSRRIAHVEVTDQVTDVSGSVIETQVLFIELDDDGSELARQSFQVPGAEIYIDAWTVKFEHERVAQGHPLMGRSLVLLRRVYSDRLAPADGFPIDTPGAVPPAYVSGDLGRFEQKIWDHFWEIATDAALARSMGVRVAQGEAVYKPVRSGQRYELVVDAAGGMSFMPLPDVPPRLSSVDE
ncbi:MAG: hypothetical protein ACYTGG_02460 [Planctomycetota bacterium]|jgi:hypothetical protein